MISTSVAVSIVKKISEVLEQVPKFALIISNNSTNKSAAFPSSLHFETIPWILTSAASHVVTAGRCGITCHVSRVTCHRSLCPVCPSSGGEVRVSLRDPQLPSLAARCPDRGRVLRVAYNNESMPYFDLRHGEADPATLEGAILQLFVARHGLRPVYMYGGYEWGSWDPAAGRWSGVVGMVGYGSSDLAVSIISYTQHRHTFVDYSPAVGTDSMVWVTQPPQKLSAASNLLRWPAPPRPLL